MEKFKLFLETNKDIPIGLIHMGQLGPETVAPLLEAHPNLFFITSHCNPVVSTSTSQPWSNLFEEGAFKPAWKKIILQYPDRFVLAFDNVFSFHWKGDFLPQVRFWRKALKTLPDDVAAAIAHKNAQRLWNL